MGDGPPARETMSDEPELAGLGKGRIEALSDGVFAIAMTLLVFNLRIPSFEHSPANAEVIEKLRPMLLPLGTYVVSFVSLGVYWIAHHNMFANIMRSDRVILWLNLYFLMFVAFLPFSTSIYSSTPYNQLLSILFGMNLFLIGLLLYITWRYASSQPGFIPVSMEESFRNQVKRRIIITPATALIGVVAAIWNPIISTIIYFSMIPIFTFVPSGLDRIYAEARKEAARIESEALAIKKQTARWTDI